MGTINATKAQLAKHSSIQEGSQKGLGGNK